MNNITKKIAFAAIVITLAVNLFFLFWTKAENNVEGRDSMQMEMLHTPMERDGQIILRLANNHVPDYPTSRACDYFAELVEERTNGRIKILNSHSALLGDEKTTVTQVMYGGIDLVRVSTALLTDFDSELIALQMPYLYEDTDHMWRVLNSEIGNSFLKGMEKMGVEGLCWYDAGARNFYTIYPVVSMEDLQGIKIRVQESAFMVDLISALGAIPVEMPFSQVEMALKDGEVEGAENNFSSYISTRNYLYAKYMVLDEHVRIPEVIIMNKQVLETLDETDQEIIRQAARDSSRKQRELWDAAEEENRRIVEAAGNIVFNLWDKEDFIEKVQPLYQKYGGDYQDIFEKINQMKDNPERNTREDER